MKKRFVERGVSNDEQVVNSFSYEIIVKSSFTRCEKLK